MTLVIIGLLVGLIMGLTGAGGALISIPLFISMMGSSLKEATVLSLIAVISGTVLNLFTQKKSADKKFVFIAVGSGAVANAATLPLKGVTPEWAVGGLLSLIALYSVWSVWTGKKGTTIGEQKNVVRKMVLTGFLIGILTTLTGLGGGVILVPILLKVFGKSYEEAMPTSLLSIMLISGLSFLLQILRSDTLTISPLDTGLIFVGSITAALGLSVVTRKLQAETLDKIRKTVFTLVTVYSITSIMLKI